MSDNKDYDDELEDEFEDDLDADDDDTEELDEGWVKQIFDIKAIKLILFINWICDKSYYELTINL